MCEALTVARMSGLEEDKVMAPGHPGFDAAVRVARRALAERIAVRAREARIPPGEIDISISTQVSKLPEVPIK